MSTNLPWHRSIYFVLAIALVLRLIAAGFWQSNLDEGQDFRFGDSDGYWQLAKRIGQGEPYQYNSEHARVFRTPGYPAFLSPLFLIWNDPPVLAARIMGSILGVVSVWLVWKIAGYLFGQTTAWFSAWLACLYPGGIAISILVLAEALFVPLMLCQFLALIKSFESKSKSGFARWAILFGVTNGLACLTRPSWLLFLPFLVVGGLILYGERKRQIQIVVIGLIFTAVTMSPWWIRNYKITGKFILTTLQTGTSLYDGLGPDATGASDMRFAPRLKKEALEEYEANQLGPKREFEFWFNERMKGRALDQAKNNPTRVLQLALVKFKRIWNPVPNNDEIGSKLIRWGIAAFFVPVILLSVCGIFLNRGNYAAMVVCLFPTVYFTLLHMVFVGSIRYRQPPMMLLLIFGAWMLAYLLDRNNNDSSTNRKKKHGASKRITTALMSLEISEKNRKLFSINCVNGPTHILWRNLGMEALTIQPTNAPSSASCWARGMSSFRGFVFFLLLVALLALVALLLLKDNLNDQIKGQVIRQLREMFSRTGIQVSLDQAEYKRGTGIRLRGLNLFDGKQPVLAIESILVTTDAELWDLLGNRLATDSVDIEGIRVFVRQDSNQQLNLQKVLSQIKLPGNIKPKAPPRIRIRDCVVRCKLNGVSNPIDLIVNQAEINPHGNKSGIYANATISSDFFKQAKLSAEYSQTTEEWRIWGSAKRFWLTREIFDHIPESFRQDAEVLSALNAKIDFDFEVSGNQRFETVPQFVVVGSVSDGVINDDRLPFPVNDLSAGFQADNTGIKFENVIADSLLGKMHLNFTTEGLSSDSPFELVANVDPLYLDQRLEARLPPEAREFLRKFSPTGNVRLNSKLRFQHGRWVPDVVVDLLDVSFAFHKFPYPLTNATGRITLDDERVTIDAVAFASGQRVVLKGEFLEPGPNSHGQLKVDLVGSIPIDAKVLSAMEQMPDIASITKKFHPRGRFGFNGLFRRVKNREGRIDELFRHNVSVQDVEFKYDLVPIAFEKVNGTIVVAETGTSFKGFRGKNVNSNNVAQGSWDPENGLYLTIDSFDVELNESLKTALPPKAIEFWNQLRPVGTLQAVRTQIWAEPNGKPLKYDFEIRHGHGQRNLSVNPVWFPYELRDISVNVSFRPGEFAIERFRGHHRKTTLTVEGNGSFNPRGWECHFTKMNFDRLVADREFTSALPESLGNTIESLDVKGLFNVGGRMSFRSIPNSPAFTGNQIETNWDLTADIDQGYIMCGVAIEDIYGAVRLTGYSHGEYFESLGGMEIDSLVWNDIQFKKIRSPIFLDNNEALLGLWATAKRRDATPQPLSGVLFDGKLAGNARFSLHGNQPFEIQATLQEGDLQEFTFELAPDYENILGKGFAGIRIVGDKTGTHALRGEGEVRLVDAKISEVPVMLSMLKLLSVKQFDRTLFNESHINFTIKGEHVFFDNLEFLGDAISIKGNGEMDFDQNLDLQFYTAVGRDGFRIPVISPLLGIASQQILVIDVKGTAGDPKVKKNFFKILNNKLKENLEDLEDSIDEGSEKLIQAAERPFERAFR